MNKRFINKTYRSERLRDTVSNSGNNTLSSSFISNGSGSGGLPFKVNDVGDYVVAKSLHSEGDFIAYSDGGINPEQTAIYLNDIADIDVTTKQNGYVLTYDAVSNTYIFKEPVGVGGIKEVYWSDVKDKPLEYNPTKHTHSISDITGNIDAGTF